MDTVAWLIHHCPQLRTLVLTASDDKIYVRSLVGAGALGYILKDEEPDTLLRAIARWLQATPGLAGVSLPLLRTTCTEDDTDALPFLTERDRQLLHGLAQGWSNARLAGELNIADQTVRNYVSRPYAALGVNSRSAATVWAQSWVADPQAYRLP